MADEIAGGGQGFSEAARALLRSRAGNRATSSAALTSRAAECAPLSSFQESIYFVEEYEPGLGLYNRPMRIRLRGALNAAALRLSIAEIFRRHEVLRSRVAVDGAGHMQRAMHGYELDFPLVDLSDEREPEAAYRVLADAEARRAFDLSEGPFARATLVRLNPDEHVLLFTSHHIAFDGWSTGVLFRELSVLYSEYAAKRESSLSEPRFQFGDFAAWQRERISSAESERDLAYWLDKLRGAPPILELPADRSRPTVRTHAAGRASRVLSISLVSRLSSLGSGEGATLFMTMLAAFQVFVSRMSGSGDVVVGVPVAGRTLPETEDMLGCFVNVLAMRALIGRDLTFRELLASVRRDSLDALEHQGVPLHVLADKLLTQRSLEYTPVVQVLFNFRNAPTTPLRIDGVEVVIERSAAYTIIPDIEFDVEKIGDEWRLGALYSAELFDGATIERWLGHFETLLGGIATAPDCCVSRLPLLTPGERSAIVDGWNDNATAPDFETCLHRLIEAQARRTPDAIAVTAIDGSLTYDELDRHANRLARALIGMGAGCGALVGICMERRVDLMVALLAVLKAGAAYLPLDPDYPSDRLAFMLADSGAKVLLAHPGIGDKLATTCAQTIRLDGLKSIDALGADDDDPGIEIKPVDPAYVIYTSGSTGMPKGAVISHRAVCNFVLRSVEFHEIRASDVVLQRTPLSFDASVLELFPPLVAGARLVLARAHGQGDGGYLGQLVEREGITVVSVVPSLLDVMLQLPETPRQFAKVRLVACGGEALSPGLRERFFAQLPWSRLHNGYGPTEATVNTTTWECEWPPTRQFVPIGRPHRNVKVYILDPEGEPVPMGVTGELFIGGVGLSDGYIDRRELNAERFVPDSFGLAGARLYRSGDLARFHPDGVIEHLGRADGQLKIRGVRIEPGEVESALMASGDVRECVVVAREDQPGDARLVAYVVPLDGCEVYDRDLRERLRRTLLPQMIPSAFVTLEQLPMTPSGKVDRRALLPDPTAVSLLVDDRVRTATQDAVAGVWAEVLKLDRVGLHDDFFVIGGHSLHAMKVMARLNSQLGADVPLRKLFDDPTIEALAKAVDAAVLESLEDGELERILAEVEAGDSGAELSA